MNAKSVLKLKVSCTVIIAVGMVFVLILGMTRQWSATDLQDVMTHGSSNIQIESITVQAANGSTHMVINDPDFIHALNQSLRYGAEGTDSVMKQWPNLHHTFRAKVLMSSGRQATALLSVFRGNDGIAVEIVYPFDIFPDSTYPSWIPFREPIPDSVKRTLERLRSSGW